MRYKSCWDCIDCIKAAEEDGTLLPTLIKMLDNHPDYLYCQEYPQDKRTRFYILEGAGHGLELDDFKFLVKKYDIHDNSILSNLFARKKNEMARYLIDYDRNYYLHRDYELDTQLVISMTYRNRPVVNELLFDYKIDIWNPPIHINRENHFSNIWRNCLMDHKMDFIKTFVEHGADVNYSSNNWCEGYCKEWIVRDCLFTPLTFAFGKGYFEVAKYLISRGANIDNPLFPAVFAAVRYGLENNIEYHDISTTVHVSSIKSNVQFIMRYGGANLTMLNNKGENIYEYIENLFAFGSDQEIDDRWRAAVIKRTKNAFDWAVKKTTISLNQTKEIVYQSMAIVMDLMVMSGDLPPQLRLSKNVLGLIMEFHGGLDDALEEKDLEKLSILWEKRKFLFEKRQLLAIEQQQNSGSDNDYDDDSGNIQNIELLSTITENHYQSVLIGSADTDEIITSNRESRISEVQSIGYLRVGVGGATILDEREQAQLDHYINTGSIFDTAAEILGQAPRLIYNAADNYRDSEIFEMTDIISDVSNIHSSSLIF